MHCIHELPLTSACFMVCATETLLIQMYVVSIMYTILMSLPWGVPLRHSLDPNVCTSFSVYYVQYTHELTMMVCAIETLS